MINTQQTREPQSGSETVTSGKPDKSHLSQDLPSLPDLIRSPRAFIRREDLHHSVTSLESAPPTSNDEWTTAACKLLAIAVKLNDEDSLQRLGELALDRNLSAAEVATLMCPLSMFETNRPKAQFLTPWATLLKSSGSHDSAWILLVELEDQIEKGHRSCSALQTRLLDALRDKDQSFRELVDNFVANIDARFNNRFDQRFSKQPTIEEKWGKQLLLHMACGYTFALLLNPALLSTILIPAVAIVSSALSTLMQQRSTTSSMGSSARNSLRHPDKRILAAQDILEKLGHTGADTSANC